MYTQKVKIFSVDEPINVQRTIDIKLLDKPYSWFKCTKYIIMWKSIQE
jgi:hypothetical protein